MTHLGRDLPGKDHVGTAALGCPAERSSATEWLNFTQRQSHSALRNVTCYESAGKTTPLGVIL